MSDTNPIAIFLDSVPFCILGSQKVMKELAVGYEIKLV
tara:strand:- start:222 stop:335 length:114 start_codon:yes stop_codon:yes gene_type:complete